MCCRHVPQGFPQCGLLTRLSPASVPFPGKRDDFKSAEFNDRVVLKDIQAVITLSARYTSTITHALHYSKLEQTQCPYKYLRVAAIPATYSGYFLS